MAKDKLVTSAVGRIVKLGGLASKVGTSLVSSRLEGLFQSTEQQSHHRTRALERNAATITEVLGNLKGVPMKIGQMLSLHDGLLPDEVTDILSGLQQQAPSVSFEVMRAFVKKELGPEFGRIKRLDRHAWAAASIGQVHRAELDDGRQVVLKIQYPGIDKVIAADMKNLKGVMHMLFAMLTPMDWDPIWGELNERLLEELDYLAEAENMRKMQALWRTDPRIIIPGIVDDLSTRHVLCMEFVEGISPEWACSESFTKQKRSQWGRLLLSFFLQGFFQHRYIHADPNLANFAFRENGAIVVYDFGCMKQVPDIIVTTYAQMTRAVLDSHYEKIPALLKHLGVVTPEGDTFPMPIVAEYADIVKEPFRPGATYTFGQDSRFYKRLIHLGRRYWEETLDFTFPKDIVFVNRTLGGHFGNLSRLGASGRWHALLVKFVDMALANAAPV
jgi:predicted unusual protein kinase regulating ubiquinone biosynthesis (AarF/ABC1/UbiB family)